MDAIDELIQLSDSMVQAASLLADEDLDDSSSSTKKPSTFLNVVSLGNVGAGKSAVLNSLIGHPVLPTGENGATRAPISIDLQRDGSLSSKQIVLQIDSKSQQVSASALRHSLQDRLSKGGSGRGRADEIYLKLRTSTAPPLKLIDLPGLDQRIMDDALLSDYTEHNDAILLIIVPASQAPEISTLRALKLAKEYDADGTRTIGVINKIDQAATDQKTLAAVQALLLNQGPRSTSDIPWVALIGQSVSIASAQSGSVGSENSLETAWRAESESLKSILTGAPQSKLGRLALVETLARQIRKRMKVRLPNLLSGLQGKSQVVEVLEDELVRLGEQMVQSAEGTRAIALELCREFEDRFLAHFATGEGSGWKVVASFEGNFPNRIKQLPLDRHFDINNVKRIVLEADGYQPYLISPEKGLRSLIKGVLELAKEPSRLCVDEVHRVLVDIVSASANATPGLGRYPPFKREVVTIASAALDGFKNEAKKMVVALVDMERAFVPPQHFIRLVQRRQLVHKQDPPQSGGSLKSLKDKSSDKDGQEGSALKIAGPGGDSWYVENCLLGYTKKQEERHFRGVITLEAEELRKALCVKNVPAKVYVGMRYWHPFTEEAIEQIKRDGITKPVVLPLYPQFSISTSGSSLRLLESIFREDEYLVNMQHTVIPSWYQREGYIKAMANLTEKELEKFQYPEKVMIFFSAHGVPLAYVEEAGDPYKAEMEECVDLIMEELEKRGNTLAYQSRVGPVEWLKPYTDATIIELGQNGVKSLLAVPISFVSEHIETLEEIDVEYKELALKSGIKEWGRVPALGCEPTFISDLADAVIESLPYVGAMAVSNLEARQSLVPLGSVEELLATYDSQRRELPPPVTMWEWGWTKSAETWNGRAAMLAVLVLLVWEVTTGEGFLHQWGILPLVH
ncbi:hypothetical protein IFM89_037971 [Coptis chinensis]|uniref:Ferrochelatase n=1 Tax=Coptis chinensis TaxID=261450 RepID=A0A835M0P5_9MAGN|nr:hypothetical protein IFM89_037971 [Coptis chinensis]